MDAVEQVCTTIRLSGKNAVPIHHSHTHTFASFLSTMIIGNTASFDKTQQPNYSKARWVDYFVINSF